MAISRPGPAARTRISISGTSSVKHRRDDQSANGPSWAGRSHSFWLPPVWWRGTRDPSLPTLYFREPPWTLSRFNPSPCLSIQHPPSHPTDQPHHPNNLLLGSPEQPTPAKPHPGLEDLHNSVQPTHHQPSHEQQPGVGSSRHQLSRIQPLSPWLLG